MESYHSREAADFNELLERFLETHRVSASAACFGIAGPVLGGRCKTTNLPWEVSEEELQRKFGWKRVVLINDLAATALAVPSLTSREVYSLNRARARRDGVVALLASGTGLGAAILVNPKGEASALPSEGGHVDFAPADEEQVSLWRYFRKQYGHVSIERVVSGPGLVGIYSWLKSSRRHKEPRWLRERMQKMDPARAITETAKKENHPLCVKTVDLFLSIYGSVAGDFALTAFATGGVYLAGGIPPKLREELRGGLFLEAFRNKGRFKGFLEKIPVRVVLNERAALLGAACRAVRLAAEAAEVDPASRAAPIRK